MRSDRSSGRMRGGRLFWLGAIIGIAGMLAAAAAVGSLIDSVQRVSTGAGRVKLAGLVLSYPELNRAEWLVVGLAALGATAIIVAVRAVLRQRSAYLRLVGRLEILGTPERHPSVNVIAGSTPEAFCAGYLRPKVYISRGALELLGRAELEAVLAHEDRHRLHRDPLRFALGRILSQALFFLPVLPSLGDRYADLAEVNADIAAVRASGGRQAPLAAALLVFDASVPAGASGISPERVDSLLGQPAGWRLPAWRLAASIGVLSGLGFVIGRTSGVAAARATFGLPFLSAQPCLVPMTLVALMGLVAVLRQRRRLAQMPSRHA